MTTVTQEEFWKAVLEDPSLQGQITTESALFNARANVLYTVLGNTLISSNKTVYVHQWETLLGITPADGETITERKAAILYSMSCNGLPLTVGVVEKTIERELGEVEAQIDIAPGKLKVSIGLETTTEQVEALKALLARVISKQLETQLEWANGLPIEYTPLEYIESDGVATMALPFDSINKTFVCEHTMGMPKATSGMYTYGGRKVSSGYGMTYRAANQGFMFLNENEYIASGKFLRGKKYKMQWEVARNEEGKFIFILAHAGETLSQIQKSFDDRYWLNAYYVFSSTEYGAKIGGATYELTINIEGESVKYVPALNPTGAPCLYCIETRTPYYNSGGDGDFIYPTETTTYSLRRVLPDWGKLTEHGLARLYHTPKDYEGELYAYAIENGYKQIVGAEQPDEGCWAPVWHEREDCIELEWVETEPPTEEGTINS